MSEKAMGRLVMALIGIAVIAFLGFNLNLNLGGRATSGSSSADTKSDTSSTAPSQATKPTEAAGQKPAGFREYPIGDEVVRNEMSIAAVWLPPVQMEGMPDASSDLIHLEADVRATEGNPNGFAKDEFVPYMKVSYAIYPADSPSTASPLSSGTMMPMVARDGLHYGANVSMPKAGAFRLVYQLEPPSVGGLGRHADSATGVAPWWKPFEVTFEWEYAGPAKPGA